MRADAVSRPRIRVIALGGTIASTRDGGRDSRAQPRLGGDELVGAVPGLDHIADIDIDSLVPTPGCSLTWSEIFDVAERISRAESDGYDGVVITQGTDTIEETAFAWELLASPSITVVVTGAMRHADLPGADGPANLLDAVRVASSSAARGHGVLVVLAGQVHRARTVRKRHTSSPAAFGSADGTVGEIVEGHIRLGLPDRPRVHLERASDATRIPVVPLVRSCLGDDGWWLPAVAAAPGAVIEGMGGGHLPVADARGVREVAVRVPIVLTSRTGAGAVLQSTYGGFAGSETDLLEAGLIPAGDLDSLKARVALTLALASGHDSERIREMFNVLGGATPLP